MTTSGTYRFTITCDPVPAEPLYGALKEELAPPVADEARLTFADGEAVIELVSTAPADVLRLVEEYSPSALGTVAGWSMVVRPA